jgi:hypothetical protein
MGAITPIAKGTAGYLDPSLSTVRARGGSFFVQPNDDPKVSSYRFATIADGDTWAVGTNWNGPVPVCELVADTVTIGGSAHAAVSSGTLTVTFQTDGGTFTDCGLRLRRL